MPVDEGSEYPCTTVRLKRILATSEPYIYFMTIAADAQMMTTDKSLFES